MNMLTRAEAIADCYPDLQPDEIQAYMVWVKKPFEMGQSIAMWLPKDVDLALAALDKQYPLADGCFRSFEGIIPAKDLGE